MAVIFVQISAPGVQVPQSVAVKLETVMKGRLFVNREIDGCRKAICLSRPCPPDIDECFVINGKIKCAVGVQMQVRRSDRIAGFEAYKLDCKCLIIGGI